MKKIYKFRYKLLAFMLLVFISTGISAQNTKSITKSFAVNENSNLFVENKYGDIIISGWNEDSIKIDITISVNGKSSDYEKRLSRIKAEINASKAYISVVTVFTKEESSIWSKIWNEVKTISLSKDNIDVHYNIFLPKTADIRVINKYGSLVVNEWNGKLDADVQHGDIRLLTDIDRAVINQRYGDFDARSIVQSEIANYNGRIDIKEIEKGTFKTKGCKIKVEKAKTLSFDSYNDDISLDDVEMIMGTTRYSDLLINFMHKSLVIDISYTDLKIFKINDSFSLIDVDMKYSETDINVHGLEFKFEGFFEGGTFKSPPLFTVDSENTIEEKSAKRNISGHFGENLSGRVDIENVKSILVLRDF